MPEVTVKLFDDRQVAEVQKALETRYERLAKRLRADKEEGLTSDAAEKMEILFSIQEQLVDQINLFATEDSRPPEVF